MSVNQQYPDKVFIFMDGSKDIETGGTGTAGFIPKYEIAIKKRTTDHITCIE